MPDVLRILLATFFVGSSGLSANQGLGRADALGLMRHVQLVMLNDLVQVLAGSSGPDGGCISERFYTSTIGVMRFQRRTQSRRPSSCSPHIVANVASMVGRTSCGMASL